MSRVRIKPPDPNKVVKLTPSRTKLVDTTVVAKALGAEETTRASRKRQPIVRDYAMFIAVGIFVLFQFWMVLSHRCNP